MPIIANYVQPKIEICLSSGFEDIRTLTIQEAKDLHESLSKALDNYYREGPVVNEERIIIKRMKAGKRKDY